MTPTIEDLERRLRRPASSNRLAGLNIRIVPLHRETVRRSWSERLFSRPWRPLVAEKEVLTEGLPYGRFIRDGDTVYMNEATRRNLEKELGDSDRV